MRAVAKEIRSAPQDFGELMSTLLAAVIAGQSIDDPLGPLLAEMLEAIGDGISDAILGDAALSAHTASQTDFRDIARRLYRRASGPRRQGCRTSPRHR